MFVYVQIEKLLKNRFWHFGFKKSARKCKFYRFTELKLKSTLNICFEYMVVFYNLLIKNALYNAKIYLSKTEKQQQQKTTEICAFLWKMNTLLNIHKNDDKTSLKRINLIVLI